MISTTSRLPAAGSVLGIDVGCSPSRKSSAACRLDWTATDVTWRIERFRAIDPERTDTIARMAGDVHLSAAAFGPLRRGLDVIGRYRTAERMLTRRLRPHIGKPGQASAPVGRSLNAHANECANAVLQNCDVGVASHPATIHERAIVEAFPSSFLGVMIVDPVALKVRRGDRSDTFFRHLVENGTLDRLVGYLLPNRILREPASSVTNHDDRAPLVCAITALCVAAGKFMAVGDDEDGWIILPPRSLVQAWAIDLLQANAAEEAPSALRIENRAEIQESAAGSEQSINTG